MTLEELELISELPNYSSFADASYYIPYSAATITKYVTNAEKELGITLFTRSNKTRTLQLTSDGEKIMPLIRRLVDDYSYLKKQAEILNNTKQQVLHLASQSRFGNIHEQKILSRFMLENPTAQVNVIKQTADDIIRDLISGKVDVALITLNKSIRLDMYFGENRPRIEAKFLIAEPDMYVGISQEHFKNRTTIHLRELEGFSMAVPFPNTNDLQSMHALDDWKRISKENNVEFDFIHLPGYDSTVFDMALARKMAVTTNNVPTTTYPGIHFLKIIDWTGGNNLFLVKCTGQQSNYVKNFEKAAFDYSNSLSE